LEVSLRVIAKKELSKNIFHPLRVLNMEPSIIHIHINIIKSDGHGTCIVIGASPNT